MSTTTLLEIPDTQMLDYSSDTDFAMHGAGHSTEWLPVEATMSDDSVFPREYSETVEIDMDHNDEDEITEYEMADGDESYGNDVVVELEDVDLAEPASLASPQHISGVNSPLVVDVASPQIPVTEVLPHPSSTIPSEHSASPRDAGSVGDGHVVQSVEAPSGERFTPIPIIAVSHESSTYLLPPSGAEPSQNPSEAHGHPEDGLVSPPEAIAVAASASELPEDQSSTLEGEIAEATGSADHEVDGAEVATHEDLTTGADDAQVEQLPYDDNTQTAVAAHEEPTHGDPHEISDGVYIDPPPAVLLSLSSSSERIDCCLFNPPHPKSRSQSPSAYASTSATPDVVLLLSQRPTLYYEPLNNVFEAFRQEEIVANMPDFADGELVLEAYDLDLRISEDNIHAGEVTLHELNVLHDGIDLTGPLRLRMSASPRFITRYHALREQVAQLSLAIEAGEETYPNEGTEYERTHLDPDLGPSQTSYEETSGETTNIGTEAVSEVVEPATDEIPDNLVPENVTDEYTDGVEVTRGEASAESPRRDDKSLGEEHHDGVDEGAHPEYDPELTLKETVQSLDADAGHQAPDAAEAGDYADYAEQPADDEESFGDDLPEEEGGAADETKSQHEVLQSTYDEPSSAIEEVPPATADEGAIEHNVADDDTVEPHTDDAFQGDSWEQPQEFSESSHEALDGEPAAELADNESYAEYDQHDNSQDFEHVEIGQLAYEVSEDPEAEEWGEYDDDEDDHTDHVTNAFAHTEDDDHPSTASSHTLSTGSKRSRDDDDEEEDVTAFIPPHSPDSKRLRVE